MNAGVVCENIETNDISEDLLNKIFEIEQDMWARGIGEYVSCEKCKKIYSKSDIYGSGGYLSLTGDTLTRTVMQIESVLGGIPSCPCCESKLGHIYDKEEYMNSIKERYGKEESFLTLARDLGDGTVGFMDGYIASLEEIFDEELRFHFSPELLFELVKEYSIDKRQRLLTVSSIGTDDKNKSLLTVFKLLKTFFGNFDDSYDDLSGIVESIVGSTTYCIFNLMGASKFGVGDKPGLLLPGKSNQGFDTDILFQSGVIKHYKHSFNLRLRDVALYSRQLEEELAMP